MSSNDDLSSASGDSIVDGVWPGSRDPHLLTRFVTYHFAGDWAAYLPFSQWAESRTKSDPAEPVCLSDWLDGQESSGSKRGGTGRFDVRGSPQVLGMQVHRQAAQRGSQAMDISQLYDSFLQH